MSETPHPSITTASPDPMRVSGFTFIRNAIRFDYPIVEAIRSILPVCDEVVVAVGRSDDNTRSLVASLDPLKIRILDTEWNESLRREGEVLAAETNKALEALSPDADWAVYIQGDEVMHEESYEGLRRAMQQWRGDSRVEGLLFGYRHFWGSYDWIGTSRKWYRREVRVIRPHSGICSYKDAQGFRKGERKLRVKPVPQGWIHHYGWVKSPEAQQAKQRSFHQYWHDEKWIRENVATSGSFDYTTINALERYTGTHPAVMNERIRRLNWSFTPDPGARPLSWRHKVLDRIEALTGIRVGEFRNYRII